MLVLILIPCQGRLMVAFAFWSRRVPSCGVSERGKSVIVSNEQLFYKKAELFPGSAFIIGVDTESRLINPQYYDNNQKRMVDALNKCRKTGCTFLVAGRIMDGVFKVCRFFLLYICERHWFVIISCFKTTQSHSFIVFIML